MQQFNKAVVSQVIASLLAISAKKNKFNKMVKLKHNLNSIKGHFHFFFFFDTKFKLYASFSTCKCNSEL